MTSNLYSRIEEHAKQMAMEEAKIKMYLLIYKLLKEEMDRVSPLDQTSS